MDIKTAEALTGLTGRHMPDATHDFLRCQLGVKEPTTVQTSAFRSVSVTVFHLIVCASTWDRATELFEKRKKH